MYEIYGLKPNISLTLEVRASQDELLLISEEEYLRQCFKSLLKVESLRGNYNET